MTVQVICSFKNLKLLQKEIHEAAKGVLGPETKFEFSPTAYCSDDNAWVLYDGEVILVITGLNGEAPEPLTTRH